MVIAIDGPAGVGKSTVARVVAQRLGLSYLDTGAMYRAVALAAAERGIESTDLEALARLVVELPVSLRPGPEGVARILLDDLEVEDRIRTPQIGLLASEVAQHSVVRRALVALQQRFGARYGAVLEGRDIGTVVFPETPHKFFLDARPEVRAARRADQLRQRGVSSDEKEILADILERDRRDRGRSESPLGADATYIKVDTSDLTLDEVIQAVLSTIS